MIFLAGKGFSETTCWTGGDGILISVTLYGPLAFSETTFWIGREMIVVLTIQFSSKADNLATGNFSDLK